MSNQKKPEPNVKVVVTGQWMMTFSDLLTLLLAFFVMLLTMSSMDDRKFRDAFGMFSGAFGTLAKQTDPGMAPDFIVPIAAPIPEILVSDLEDLLDRHMREESADELTTPPDVPPEPEDYKPLFTVERVPNGVEVRIAGDLLFELGKARLRPRSVNLLRVVAGEVADMQVDVRVQSWVAPQFDRDHAWAVSLDRASAVADVIARTRGVDGKRVSLMGYGRPADEQLNGSSSVVALKFFMDERSGVIDVDTLQDEVIRTEDNLDTDREVEDGR